MTPRSRTLCACLITVCIPCIPLSAQPMPVPPAKSPEQPVAKVSAPAADPFVPATAAPVATPPEQPEPKTPAAPVPANSAASTPNVNPFEAAARESAPAASAAAPVATTDNPFEQIARDTFSGRYFSDEVRMRIEKGPDGFGGTVRFKGKTFALEGKLKEGRLEGTFGEGTDHWPFEAQVDGDKLLYTAGEYKATLTRCRLPELKGAYESKTTRIEFLNRDGTVNGTIRINGLRYDFSTTECGGELQGVFKRNGKAFPFCLYKDADLIKDPDKISLESASFRDVLERDKSEEIHLAAEKSRREHDARVKACEEKLNDALSKRKSLDEQLAKCVADGSKAMLPIFDKFPPAYEGKYWTDLGGGLKRRDTVTISRQAGSLRIAFGGVLTTDNLFDSMMPRNEFTIEADPVTPADIQTVTCTAADGDRKKVVIVFRTEMCKVTQINDRKPTPGKATATMEFEVESPVSSCFDQLRLATAVMANDTASIQSQIAQNKKDIASAQAALDQAQGKTPVAAAVAEPGTSNDDSGHKPWISTPAPTPQKPTQNDNDEPFRIVPAPVAAPAPARGAVLAPALAPADTVRRQIEAAEAAARKAKEDTR